MDNNCIIYIIILFPFFLSSSQISPSLRLLISIFSIRLPQHADHQWPPLDTVDLTKDHHSTPQTIYLLYSASGSFFFLFSFFVHIFWLWFDGWVVVGGFELWLMAMGGLRWVDRWWVG